MFYVLQLFFSASYSSSVIMTYGVEFNSSRVYWSCNWSGLTRLYTYCNPLNDLYTTQLPTLNTPLRIKLHAKSIKKNNTIYGMIDDNNNVDIVCYVCYVCCLQLFIYLYIIINNINNYLKHALHNACDVTFRTP